LKVVAPPVVGIAGLAPRQGPAIIAGPMTVCGFAAVLRSKSLPCYCAAEASGERSYEAGKKFSADALVAPLMPRTMDDVLEDFLAQVCDDDIAAPAQPWGEKLGHSLFDEQEILGRFVPLMEDPDFLALIDELDLDDDDDADDDDADDDDSEEMGPEYEDMWPHVDAYAEESSAGLPRAARVLQPLCSIYRVGESSGASCDACCPICLETLQEGEAAWRLPCTHAFHEVCMIRFLKVRRANTACPVCRCDIKKVASASLSTLQTA